MYRRQILSTDEAVFALLGSPDETEIRIQKITENLYLFFGLGGNIAVSIGDDGVLIVDDQIPSLIPKIKDAIKTAAAERTTIRLTFERFSI